jgi:hypothetical protein
MDKKLLIGVSILAVVLCILGSLSNVVGYQSVQSSNQSVVKERINQKELLFQTICDIANNKEIQRIILKSQLNQEGFFNPDVKISGFTPQVLTKNQLKQMYVIGLVLSKTISKSRIHSMLERYQMNNREIQNEINAVIEKNATLKREMTQFSSSKCDCENENTTRWSFPALCTLLYFLFWFAYGLWITGINTNLVFLIGDIGKGLNCFWSDIAP